MKITRKCIVCGAHFFVAPVFDGPKQERCEKHRVIVEPEPQEQQPKVTRKARKAKVAK